MATVSDIIQRVRLLFRDKQGGTFSDDDIITVMTMVCGEIHRHLSNIQSTLALSSYTIDTVSGIERYGIAQVAPGQSIVPDIEAVYLRAHGDAEPTLLTRIDPRERELLSDETGRPDRFYVVRYGVNDQMGLYPIPDGAYTVVGYYMGAPPVLEMNAHIPWSGVWDDYIALATAVRLRESVEGDITYLSYSAAGAYSQAMNATYRRGLRNMTSATRTNWFVPEGV